MNLAVVILNWNATEDTENCLRSVKAWSSNGFSSSPTIWVVDNDSDPPGIDEVTRKYRDVHFLCNEVNLGFAAANNLAITAALASGNDAILLLNNDAFMDDQGIESMMATLASNPQIGVVGPTLWDQGELLSAGGRDIARHEFTHLRPPQLPTDLLDVEYVPGTVALVAARVFETVGLLDEDYFFSGEMADLCFRARQHGFRCVIDPGARATHNLDRSAELRKTLHVYYVFRNRFLYARKHYPRKKAWHYTVWAFRGTGTAVAAMLKGNVRLARAVGLGVLDGLRGRFGGQNDRILG